MKDSLLLSQRLEASYFAGHSACDGLDEKQRRCRRGVTAWWKATQDITFKDFAY